MKGLPSIPWGKTNRQEGDALRWHPLVDHLADVTAVAWTMLRCCRSLRHRMARLAGVDSFTQVQLARLCVFVALHDLGKANHGFQRKAHTKSGLRAGHVSEAVAALVSNSDGRRLLLALNWSTLESWSTDSTALLLSSIGHHGEPCSTQDRKFQHNRALWCSSNEGDPEGFLHLTMDAVQQWLPEAFVPDPQAIPVTPEFTHVFAGLVMFADWLGSSVEFFPFTTEAETPGSRWIFAKKAAEMALSRIGFDTTDLGVPEGDVLKRLLPEGCSSHPSQVAMNQIPLNTVMALLEEETGHGKTEAAFALFLRMFAKGRVDGVYFALPTRVAARQIHGRLVKMARAIWGKAAPPVVLAVPGYLKVEDASGVHLPPSQECQWADEPMGRGWVAENVKRCCGGAIVVGTIDQVQLSAMQERHSSMRTMLLLRMLLVVDEVHASDTYMRRILDEVLGLRRAAHAPTLMLSATLGAEACEHFFELKPSSVSEAVLASYPRITWMTAEGQMASVCPPPQGRRKGVRVRCEPWLSEASRVAHSALAAARRGARVLIIRNTVAGCRATQRELEVAALGSDADLLFRCRGVAAPHHSRYSRSDRKALDDALTSAFGRQRKVGGIIAVTTQTAEQSLDIDADILFTDLCPIDVFLQRLGRLFRFAISRPEGFEHPTCVVLVPPSMKHLFGYVCKSGNERGKAYGPHGLGTVYPDITVLKLTWDALRAHPVLDLPVDARKVLESVLHPDCRKLVKERALLDNGKYVENCIRHDRLWGASAVVDFQKSYGSSEFSPQRLPTRLGTYDRWLRLRGKPRSPFGLTTNGVQVPGFWGIDIPEDVDEADTELLPNGFSVRINGVPLVTYDSHGLRPHRAQDNADIQDDDF